MEWKDAETTETGLLKIPERWLHLYYYEALNVLFRFENALRLFVYVILKKELFEKWDMAAISEDTTIRTETKKRISQAREHGYLGYEVTSPMLYLNTGELTQIITSAAYWKHFAPYFKATKAIVLTKLQEIGTVRNTLAHFRPLKNDDIELIKLNSKHVLLEIENCLVQITSISQLVPTNSDAIWYKDLKSIGNEHLTTSLYFSQSQDWVRVELSYNIHTLDKMTYGPHYISYSVGNFRTPQLIANCPSIRKNCIYVSEGSLYGNVDQDFNVTAQKKISIVFYRKALESGLNDIATELKDVALKVEEETALVLKDNLAQGEFIEAKAANAMFREAQQNNPNFWQLDLDGLITQISEVDNVEFWGQRNHYAVDFISATSHYPWMPSSVSKPTWF